MIWKILHDGAPYVEYGTVTSVQAAKRRIQRLKKELRILGYFDELKPLAIAVSSA